MNTIYGYLSDLMRNMLFPKIFIGFYYPRQKKKYTVIEKKNRSAVLKPPGG